MPVARLLTRRYPDRRKHRVLLPDVTCIILSIVLSLLFPYFGAAIPFDFSYVRLFAGKNGTRAREPGEPTWCQRFRTRGRRRDVLIPLM